MTFCVRFHHLKSSVVVKEYMEILATIVVMEISLAHGTNPCPLAVEVAIVKNVANVCKTSTWTLGYRSPTTVATNWLLQV